MASNSDWPVPETARTLHKKALVCDYTLPYADIGDPRKKAETLPRFAASGVDCVSLTVGGDSGNPSATLALLARERAFFKGHPDKYLLVDTVDDIRRAKRDGKLAIMFHFQGTGDLVGDLNMVDVFYRLGVRHMLLAYNSRNAAADGCFEANDAGLSAYGKKLVAEMNRVGMQIDCAHTGHRSALEAMEISEAPVIVSHGNPFGLHPHPRNIKDDLIKACAGTGGVIGILGISNMLGAGQSAKTSLLVDHIDYCVQLVGVDHVGISLDYVYDPEATFFWATAQADGTLPKDGNYTVDMPMVQPEQYPEITAELFKRGYDDDDILKILGENWLRVCSQVWK